VPLVYLSRFFKEALPSARVAAIVTEVGTSCPAGQRVWFIAVRIRDEDGLEGVGYTYSVATGSRAIRSLIEDDLERAAEVPGFQLGLPGDFWRGGDV
jgi:hypothetical protein